MNQKCRCLIRKNNDRIQEKKVAYPSFSKQENSKNRINLLMNL